MTERESSAGPTLDGSAYQRGKARLFARMWAVAALAHVVGNGFGASLYPEPTPKGVALFAVTGAAVLVLFRPTRGPLLLLSATIVVSAIIEIPVLGNHWFIAAAVSLAYILAGGNWVGFEPAARLVLLVFYSMAAFAKLNTGFLHPEVSCAVLYANQSLESWALSPIAQGSAAASILPYVVAATELAIPALLVIPRSRALGVFLGLSFHGLIALDLAQHFYDFSAVLAALFVLFLPSTWAEDATERMTRLPSPLRLGLAAAALFLVLILIVSGLFGFEPARVLFGAAPYLLWLVYLAGLLILVVTVPRSAAPLSWRPAGLAWLAVILALLNGLSPWTEVKTAFGYTMYSNLEVVQGETNHVLVRSSWPMRDGHARLVVIESSSDPGLAEYVSSGWLLPWASLRTYVDDNPGIDLTYRDGVRTTGLGGERITVPDALLSPQFSGPTPWWWRWSPLRSLDAQSPPRCQDVWLPAL